MRAPEKDETAGPKESLRKLDELDQARSERSSGSIFSGTSKMTGRCDTTTYAEAMQSVADLTDVVSVKNAQNRRATNQMEAFLLTDIEESSESGRSDSMGRIHIGLAPRSARGPATDAATAEAPGPPLSEEDKKGGHGSDEWHSREELGGEDDERPPGLHRWLLRRFFITSFVGLLMLAPSTATIVLYASDPVYDEELDLDGELPPKPPFANATTEQIFLLILRPVYALAAAYSTSLVLAAFFKNAKVQRWMPGFVLLFMHHTFHLGWALPAMLYPAAIGIFYRVGVDGDAWSFLVELRRFLATAVWLMAGGLSSAVLDSGVALMQRQLTLHHYEQRSQTAYDTQRCLRKIVAAAHAAERHAEKVRETRAVEAAAGVLQMRMRQFAQRVARERGPRRSSRISGNSARSATAPPASADRPSDLSCSRDEVLPSDVQVRIVQSRSEHGHIEKSLAPPSRSASKAMLNTDAPAPEPGRLATPHPPKEPPRADTRAKELDRQLDILSGPLDLGPGITAARTFSQAGRRAVKIFRVLMAQEELRVPQVDGQEPAVDRDKLVLWAFRDGGRKSSSRLAGSVFRYGPAITMDEFIKVVEESYQEQRLITASVAAFDRLHSEVRVFLQVVLLFVFLILLLAVWSVSVVTWLVPIGSALLSAAVLAGRITSDILDCFFFAYAPPSSACDAPLTRCVPTMPPRIHFTRDFRFRPHHRPLFPTSAQELPSCPKPAHPCPAPDPRHLPPPPSPLHLPAAAATSIPLPSSHRTSRRTSSPPPPAHPPARRSCITPSPLPSPSCWPPAAATSSGRTTSATAWPSRSRATRRRCCRA